MTFSELSRAFDAKGSSPHKRRAKCPCHKSKGLTLAIYADEEGLGVHCFAGCSNDDVLEAVGLTWKDLKTKKEWLSTEEFKAVQAKKRAQEAAQAEHRKQVRYWTNETRCWETVASLLHAHLIYARDKPEGRAIARLWRKALATARARHERLTEFWPTAPEVYGYHLVRVPKEITRKFTGDEIAEVLGL